MLTAILTAIGSIATIITGILYFFKQAQSTTSQDAQATTAQQQDEAAKLKNTGRPDWND